MPVTVSSNAQHDLPITEYGKNGLHYTTIFGNRNKENPTCCGLFTITEAPETNTFTYPCTIFTIVLEGEFDLEDQEKPGEHIILKAGDVMRVDKGRVVNWRSPTRGKAFFAAEIEHDVNFGQHFA